MAYRLNRRCGPGSGIKHAPPMPSPITPKPTVKELAERRRVKRATARKRARQRRRDTEARQLAADKRFHASRLAAGRAPLAPGALRRREGRA